MLWVLRKERGGGGDENGENVQWNGGKRVAYRERRFGASSGGRRGTYDWRRGASKCISSLYSSLFRNQGAAEPSITTWRSGFLASQGLFRI